MAALQTLRNKPALLMSVIGGALLLFIITLVFDNNSGIGAPDMEAGEAYGEEISIQDYDSKVAKEENFIEVYRSLQSNNPQALNEDDRAQIRQQVWNDFVSFGTMKNEAEKLGLAVTEKDIKNALSASNFDEVRFLMLVGAATTGNPTIEGYRQFITNFEKTLTQIRQQQPQMEEMFIKLHEASLYCESKLEEAILRNKYTALLRNSFTSNSAIAEMKIAEGNTKVDAEIAVVPYTTIADSTIKVDSKDLDKKYASIKKNFFTAGATRHIKFINVPVQASSNDIAQIRQEVKDIEEKLNAATSADDVVSIVADSKTTIPFNNTYFVKEAYTNDVVYNLAATLDTMAVGTVKNTANVGRDIVTYKLVGKVNTADSLLIRGIGAKDKTQADSILNAINAGSKFGDVAVALGQQDTAFWVYNPIYVKAAAADSGVYTNVCQLDVKKPAILSENQNFMIMEVLEKKHNSEKYNVAIVKYPIEYSKETYDNALSKLNNFLANNKTVKEFADNAAKEGYYINNIPNFNSNNTYAISNIKGEQAKVAVRWILDEAEAGDISNAFECPTDPFQGNILAVAVVSASDDEYLPLDNEGVKEYITALAQQDKKAEVISNNLKDVKSIAEAQAKNALSENLNGVTPAQMIRISTTNSVEPLVAGALEKAKAGEFIGNIKGAAGVYMVKVNNKEVAKSDLTLNTAIFQLNQMKISSTFGMMQNNYGMQNINMYPENLLNTLSLYNGEVVDKRYKFDR